MTLTSYYCTHCSGLVHMYGIHTNFSQGDFGTHSQPATDRHPFPSCMLLVATATNTTYLMGLRSKKLSVLVRVLQGQLTIAYRCLLLSGRTPRCFATVKAHAHSQNGRKLQHFRDCRLGESCSDRVSMIEVRIGSQHSRGKWL